MNNKLWFVTNGVQVVSVFDSRKSAESELNKYQDDPDFNYYDYYGLDIDELEEYPDEYDIALDEGFLG